MDNFSQDIQTAYIPDATVTVQSTIAALSLGTLQKVS
jgi:hypothetical protein